jgi:hypothetical protein
MMARKSQATATLDPLTFDTSVVVSDKHARIITALQDEVYYWRELQTCYVANATHVLTCDDGERNWLQINPPHRRLAEATGVLSDALTGDLFDKCIGCDGDLRPGDDVISYGEDGEGHARCAGAKPGHIAAGRMPIDADALDYSDLSPEEAAALRADPHVAIYKRARLFTSEQVQAWLDKGKAALAAANARDAERAGIIDVHFAASQDDVGGRYGLTDSPDRASIQPCKVWFTNRHTAIGYATVNDLTVWDLVAGKVVFPEAV